VPSLLQSSSPLKNKISLESFPAIYYTVVWWDSFNFPSSHAQHTHTHIHTHTLSLSNALTLFFFLGWNAPRNSLLLVHPDGLGSKATNEEINISFDPVPDYAGIAKAAAGGKLHAARVESAGNLDAVLREAIESVKNGMPAVVDAKVVKGC
jgi:hypothetical protein